MQVPHFEAYYPSEESLSRSQERFFQGLERALSKGLYVDIDGNISYVFMYLYNRLAEIEYLGVRNLYDHLEYIGELYSEYPKISNYCRSWALDCLLYSGEYELFLSRTEPSDILKVRAHKSNLRLNLCKFLGIDPNPLDIFTLTNLRRGKIISENQSLFKEKVENIFSKYAEPHRGWFNLLEDWCSSAERPHYLFTGSVLSSKKTLGAPLRQYQSLLKGKDVLKDLARAAENECRHELKLPGIGEGWVSEDLLYRRIKEEFPETVVIQHGQPRWLGLQHFDIWLPMWKVAIEYHGKQHFEPVDFFGGDEAFKKRKKLDEQKESLAINNGVSLFVVRYDCSDDDEEKVISSIQKIAERRVIPME